MHLKIPKFISYSCLLLFIIISCNNCPYETETQNSPTEKLLHRKLGSELLRNTGFENLNGPWPSAWGKAGNPIVDASGQNSHTGLVGVRCKGSDNIFFQVVTVKAEGLYLLGFHARTSEKGQQTRLQVNWSDAKHKFLSTDIEVLEVDRNWKRFEMEVKVPELANFAAIYVSPHEQGLVWYDNLSFVELQYENRQ